MKALQPDVICKERGIQRRKGIAVEIPLRNGVTRPIDLWGMQRVQAEEIPQMGENVRVQREDAVAFEASFRGKT